MERVCRGGGDERVLSVCCLWERRKGDAKTEISVCSKGIGEREAK